MGKSVADKIAELAPEAQQRVSDRSADLIAHELVARGLREAATENNVVSAGADRGVSLNYVMAGWSEERRARVEARARQLIDQEAAKTSAKPRAS